MYLIIVGAGKIGSNLIDMATSGGNDVVVIEQKEAVANEISTSYDCLVLNADATDDGVLSDAGIDRADAVISTTNLDTVNAMVMLLAREHDVPSLVSVVHDPNHISIFEKIGAHIVENPQRLIADHLYHSVRYPGIKNFMRLGNETEFIEVGVKERAPILDRPLQEAREQGVLPEDVLVAAIKRGEHVVMPKGDTTVEEGDLVTVLVDESSMNDLLRAFAHPDANGR